MVGLPRGLDTTTAKLSDAKKSDPPRAITNAPVTVKLSVPDATRKEIAQAIRENGEVHVLLGNLRAPGNWNPKYRIRVFVNNPKADKDTRLNDNFVIAITPFSTKESMKHPVPVAFPLAGQLKRLGWKETDPIEITFVVVTADGKPLPNLSAGYEGIQVKVE